VRDLTVWDRIRMWWRIKWEKFPRVDANERWHPSRLVDRPPVVGQETVRLLRQLVTPQPHDALILGGAFKVPLPWSSWERPRLSPRDVKKMQTELIDNKLVIKAVDRVIRIMASAGYVPLTHSHATGTSEYFFHARGIEAEQMYFDHPHKLPFKAATIMPHLPFSHTVYGDRADRHDGTVAPDVAAFIMMDQHSERSALGPRLYWLDKLVGALGDDRVALGEKDFQIIPEQSIDDNKHGAISAIELFGQANDGTRFMRFDYGRIEPAASSPRPSQARRAIWALRRQLDRKTGDTFHHVDLLPGDVLLVNNWRAAAAWDEECKQRGWDLWRPYNYPVHVHPNDRLVIQINFYHLRGRRSPTTAGHTAEHH
jgi:hypothetical protein